MASVDAQFAFRSDRYAWFVVFLLCLASIVAMLDRQVINLLVDPIRADLRLSDTQMSLLLGFAFALFHAFVAIPLGRVADAGNRKVIIVVGMVLWSIATALCGIANGFYQLFVARVLVGVGEATLFPAGVSLLADYFPRRKLSRAVSVLNCAGFIGAGIALGAGGFVIDRMTHVGTLDWGFLGDVAPWQATFLIVASPGILLAIAVWYLLREPPRIGSLDGKAQDPLPLAEAWGYLMSHKTVIGPVVLGFTSLALVMYSIGAWAPTYFIRTHGMTASEIGAAMGLLFMILGTTGVVSGGLFADWLRGRGYEDANLRAGVAAALFSLPFMVAFPLVPDQNLSLILFAPAIFFGTMPFGAGPPALPLIVPNRLRGQLMAVYLLSANLIGLGLGPWLVAVFTDYVFGDPSLIRYSISFVAATMVLVGIGILLAGLNPYRIHIRKIEARYA